MKLILLSLLFILSTQLSAQTFTGGSCPIIDFAINESSITVSGLPTSMSASFGVQNLCFNITHTYDSDIKLTLISPTGVSIGILQGVGGGDDGFVNTCLYGTGTPISSGAFPFTGNFKSMGILGNINVGNPNGIWKLRTEDVAGADQGTLDNWSLSFSATPAQPFLFDQSNLPIVVINSGAGVINGTTDVLSDFKIYYHPDNSRNYTSNTPYFNGKAAIGIRGNYSASLPQKPYSVEIQDGGGVAYDTSFFGMPSESDWILLANYNDKTFLRNSLTYDLFGKMGHYSVRTIHVDVMVNGEYQGIYVFMEKIKRNSGRVDVAKLTPTEISGVDVTGGYITKIDYWDATNSWQLPFSPPANPGADVHMVYYYPKPELIVPQQKTYIQSVWSGFETALYSPTFADPLTGYRSFISETSWVDYLIIGELTRNVDSYKKSRFFYKEKDNISGALGQIKAGPVWDFDWSLKAYNSSDDMSDWSYDNVTGQDVNPPGYYIRLMEDPWFQDKFKCRYSDFRRNILDTVYLFNYIDSMSNVLNESQAWHYEVWGHLTLSNTSPEWTPTSFPDAMAKLKDFYRKRTNWIDANIPGTLTGCSFASMNEIELPNILRAHPNPSNDLVNIHILSNPSLQYLSIYDANGSIVMQKEIPVNQYTTLLEIETASWSNGIYILALQGETGLLQQKLVVQH